jgi:hypothetical protein
MNGLACAMVFFSVENCRCWSVFLGQCRPELPRRAILLARVNLVVRIFWFPVVARKLKK